MNPSRGRVARLIFAIGAILAVARAADELTLTPFDPSGIYAVGQKAGWKITGNPQREWRYALKKNGAEVIESGALKFTDGAATVATAATEPEMIYLELSAAGENPVKRAAGAAVAPRELKPVEPRPADFDDFWAAKLKLLEKVAAEPVITPGDSGVVGVEYATVRLNNVGGAHVYGQLAKPAREGRFPAMLIMQWAGAAYPLQKKWVTDRAAEGWLAFNIEPHDVPGDLPAAFYAALPQMIKNYNTIYDDDRDRNYFLQMYLGDYRAMDYLASRPDWDGRVLLAMGTSMGGQQSFAVAGLHPKVTHMIVHVPAGADANATQYGRSASYPNWNMRNPKVRATAPYFDTVNFASRIKATSLVSMGFIDTVCAPTGVWTAFNQIAGRKEVVPLVEAAHNHQSTPEQQRAYTERSAAWLAALVKGEEPAVR